MGSFILPVSLPDGVAGAARHVVREPVVDARLSTLFHVVSVRGGPAGNPILDGGQPQVPGGVVITYIGPLLAILVGIVHAAIAPVVVIGDVKPNLVLVAVVLVTSLAGFLPGIVLAFVAGLTANLLVSDPLGATPLAMLVVAALTAGGARALGRAVWIYPVVAAAAGSIVADLLVLGTSELVGEARIGAVPSNLVIGAAMLNAVVCAVLLLPARLLAGRYVADETGAW
jgi:rod shape-determining protein MreD